MSAGFDHLQYVQAKIITGRKLKPKQTSYSRYLTSLLTLVNVMKTNVQRKTRKHCQTEIPRNITERQEQPGECNQKRYAQRPNILRWNRDSSQGLTNPMAVQWYGRQMQIVPPHVLTDSYNVVLNNFHIRSTIHTCPLR